MTDPLESSPALPDYDEVWTNVYGDIQEHGPVHRHMNRIVRRILGSLDYSSVIDIGCGPGHNFELLTDGRSLTRFDGYDISPLAVKKAAEVVGGRVPGDFQVGDIQTGHPVGAWDLAYCSLIFEHLPDDRAAIRNLRAITSRYLLITTIAGNFERYRAWDEYMGHVRNYRRGELEEKLSDNGFTVLRSIYWGFPFYSPLARRVQNLSKVGTGNFGKGTELMASVLYGLYFLNSSRRGDLLVVLAAPEGPAASRDPD
jgi:trans-aconitate methyltransferase